MEKKIIIIGSGPAGLTAAIYAARSNLKPLIIEGPKPGGQLITTSYVENWPGEKKILGHELMKNIRDHAASLECEFLSEMVQTIKADKKPFTLTTDKGKTFSAESIIIATGATPKKLHCPGEEQYWGKGVSTCAICDGTFYKDQPTVVIGGGDTAAENASFLTNFTDKVTIVHILDKLTASPAMQKRILDNPKIKIIYSSTVTEFRGDGEKLQEVVVTDQNTKQEQVLPANGAFVSIGLSPNTKFLQGTVELDDWGYIKIGQNKKLGHTSTSVDGIFAAGDAHDFKYRQAITASGFGCMAALDAERYLES